MPPRHSVTIKDNHEDHKDQDYNNKFKLDKPSQGDQGRQNKTKAHYTISAVDSCPEVAVYAGKCHAPLVDSGAAVSLIHLQAYKLMPDTLKTVITLPGKLETLTTADSSPMHIIGHATITCHLKNLSVTHHFIVVESLMTDIILGIDFQRQYRISYNWDEEKRCYIRHKGQFLCYTEDMESGINRVSVAKTIRIHPKHNGAISVSIKGHNIKTPTACFIGPQYMDLEVKSIDRVHDISRYVTLQVLVINNSNQDVNFPKGMKIGHLEPPIDELMQIPINSAKTQWMLPKTIKPDSFTPPKYQLDATIQQQLDNLLQTFKDQFAKDEMTIGTDLN